jgi:hypothetical protein
MDFGVDLFLARNKLGNSKACTTKEEDPVSSNSQANMDRVVPPNCFVMVEFKYVEVSAKTTENFI